MSDEATEALVKLLEAHELSYRTFQDRNIAWCICGCSWNINEAQSGFITLAFDGEQRGAPAPSAIRAALPEETE